MGVARSMRPAGRRLAEVLVVAIALSPSLAAQALDVGDPVEDYLRLLQISGDARLGSFTLRPAVSRGDQEGLLTEGHIWASRRILPLDARAAPAGPARLEPVEARLRMFVNTRHPVAQNDGAVWQGKGLTTALDVGTGFAWRGLRVAIKPTLIHAQNSDFALAPVTVEGMPEYAYPWRRIDLPQRFGPDPTWRIDPGQSEVRLSGFGVTGGFTTRSLWWGPGIRSAIVMSNNAAGVPHAFLGTRGPRDIGIGTLEVSWIWGRLKQSEWFDPAVANDRRFLTGLVVAYSPSFLSGLSLGVTRAFYGAVPEGGLPLSDLFLVIQGVRKEGLVTPDNPTGDDETDQLASLFGRWVLAESGFEVYGEWSRNDHSGSFEDFLLEPEHSQGYTLGLQKAVELSNGNRVALRGELTHLEREATFRLRPNPVYYSHHIVTQGYTHRGEVLGAGIGPGGIQQHVGMDLYAGWGRAGAFLQRRVHDNDAFYAWAAENGASFDRHDVSFDVGAHALAFLGDFDLGASLTFTRELNRYFFGPDVTNLNLGLTARWRQRAR